MAKFFIPKKIKQESIKIIMICDAPPENKEDYFYTSHDSLYVTNTIDAFNNAGIRVKSISDILEEGVYLTIAVKIPRKSLIIPAEVIKKYSYILEEEIDEFPNVKAILLMGDTAIRLLNFISQRTEGKRTIPVGATYKIRGGKFYYKNIRVFPSYLQTGKNFLIEKSKQKMVSEDIKNAFKSVQN